MKDTCLIQVTFPIRIYWFVEYFVFSMLLISIVLFLFYNAANKISCLIKLYQKIRSSINNKLLSVLHFDLIVQTQNPSGKLIWKWKFILIHLKWCVYFLPYTVCYLFPHGICIHHLQYDVQSHLSSRPPLIRGHLPWVASFNSTRSFYFLYFLTGLSGRLFNVASKYRSHSDWTPVFSGHFFLFCHVICLTRVRLGRTHVTRSTADND